MTYFLSLPLRYKDWLGAVRHWENLKIGFTENAVWTKDFTPAQMDSVEVKSLPYKTVFYASGAQLFLKGSLLPHQPVPSLLWTPIERGLPVRLPPFNHHYFGIKDKAIVKLRQTDAEKEGYALLTSTAVLQSYIETAPAVRLQALRWVITDEGNALILGTPLLPLQGKVFWRRDDFLFPAGYDLEFPLLQDTVQGLLDPQGDTWIVWTENGKYFTIEKEATTPLSIASFRKTLQP